jgi:hypothetical protein
MLTIIELLSHFVHPDEFFSIYLFLNDHIMQPLIRDLEYYNIYEPTYTTLVFSKVFYAHLKTKL